MKMPLSEFKARSRLDQFSQGTGRKLGDDSGFAWVSWDGEGEVVLQVFDVDGISGSETKALHLAGRCDGQVVDVESLDGGDAGADIDTFGERVSSMSLIVCF